MKRLDNAVNINIKRVESAKRACQSGSTSQNEFVDVSEEHRYKNNKDGKEHRSRTMIQSRMYISRGQFEAMWFGRR